MLASNETHLTLQYCDLQSSVGYQLYTNMICIKLSLLVLKINIAMLVVLSKIKSLKETQYVKVLYGMTIADIASTLSMLEGLLVRDHNSLLIYL